MIVSDTLLHLRVGTSENAKNASSAYYVYTYNYCIIINTTVEKLV